MTISFVFIASTLFHNNFKTDFAVMLFILSYLYVRHGVEKCMKYNKSLNSHNLRTDFENICVYPTFFIFMMGKFDLKSCFRQKFEFMNIYSINLGQNIFY